MTHRELHVAASPELLYETLTDVSGWEQWFSFHSGWPDGPPPDLQRGTRFRHRVTLLGASDTVTWTVTELRAPTRIGLLGKGTLVGSAELTFDLDQDGDGTQLRYAVGVHVGRMLRPFASAGARGLAVEVGHAMRRLKAHIEGDDVDTVAPASIAELEASSGIRATSTMIKLASRIAPRLDTDAIATELERRAATEDTSGVHSQPGDLLKQQHL